MRKQTDFKHWCADLKAFEDAGEVAPPPVLGENISACVSSDLNPPVWKISAKLAGIMAVTTPLVLLFCPQFGLSLGRSDWSPMNLFMRFGPGVCMAACGALFMSITVIAAVLILRPEELRPLRRNKLLQLSFLSLLALGAFICFGADVILPLAIGWTIGSIIGGMLVLEAGTRIRLERGFAT